MIRIKSCGFLENPMIQLFPNVNIPGGTKGATDPHTVPGHPGTPDREVQKIIIRTFQEPSKKLVKTTE